MRLKTKLVLAISALVFLIAGLVSLLYVHQLARTAVQQTYDTNLMVARQVRFALQNALESGLRDRTVDPNNPSELRELVTETVRNDVQLKAVLESVDRYSATVYDVNIGDSRGMTLLSTNPDNEGKPLPSRPNYAQLLKVNPLRTIIEAFGNPTVFDVVAPLENNGKLFATVNVGVHTSLLRAVYEPLLKNALRLMALALIVALTAALLLSNLALRPLTEISRQLDRLTAAEEAPAEGKDASRKDVAALVSTKIEKIGQRMRNVEEVYSALRENLDQILGNLQDGILLFTEDKRAVLVSEAARRFLNVDHDVLGRHAREIFTNTTVLGRTLRETIDAGANIVKEEIRTENGLRIQASVDFIYDDESHRGLGALVTLHDLESAEKIESELELSRSEESHQRHRGASGAFEVEIGRGRRARDEASGGDRRRDPAAGPRGANARGLLAAGGAAVARTGLAPGDRRCAGAGRRRTDDAEDQAHEPHAGRTADRQRRRRSAEAGGAECDPEWRTGHAGGRPA